MNTLKVIALTVLLSLILGACGMLGPAATPTPASCGAQSREWLTSINDLLGVWDDANSLASSTPRSSLATQIAELQKIRRDAEKLIPPACAQKVHTNLITYMDHTITGYTFFLQQEIEATVNAKFQQAKGFLDLFAEDYSNLQQEASTP
jgi:hypothetical protein